MYKLLGIIFAALLFAASCSDSETSTVKSDDEESSEVDTDKDEDLSEEDEESKATEDPDVNNSSSDMSLAEALAADLESSGGPDFGVDTSCVGETVVEGIGKDRLNELGIIADDVSAMDTADFTAAESQVIVGALTTCGDSRELMEQALTSTGLPTETISCMLDALSDEQLSTMLEAPTELDPDVASSISECGATN